MKWKIVELLKAATNEIEIDEQIDFSEAATKNPDIKQLSKVHVAGNGSVDATNRRINFHLTIKGAMTLACALTLDDVIYSFKSTINPVFIWDLEKYDAHSEEHLVTGDTIELAPLIWQEIFLQIPLRVVKDDAYDELARQGISILSEEDLLKEEEERVDPRLSILKELKLND